MRLLRHEHNTTFRVDTNDSTFVLRIHRPGVHGPNTIGSETAWLRALVRDTHLGVPEPVVALDGSTVVVVPPVEGTEPQPAVLFRWQDGSFVGKRITPRHLRQVGALMAGLQRHAAQWARSEEFVRPRVDTLTTAAKKHSIAHNDSASGPRPTPDDAQATIALVDELRSVSDAAVVDRALQIVWATMSELARQPRMAGLIHADLHLENVLFHRGVARAIDFDDCGWGPYLYDLAVTLWELEGRDRYPEFRDALLDEYSRHLALPPSAETHLNALFILRKIQILVWILESRNHASFRDHWFEWAGDEINSITVALQRHESGRL